MHIVRLLKYGGCWESNNQRGCLLRVLDLISNQAIVPTSKTVWILVIQSAELNITV